MALHDGSTVISISPTAAANAGCAAAAIQLSYQNLAPQFPTIWDNAETWTWKLEATPARGWTFVEWQLTRDNSGSTTSTTNNSNPWSGGSYLSENEETIANGGGTYYARITAVTAVFQNNATGLILRSATSGQILHGAGGTILHDE